MDVNIIRGIGHLVARYQLVRLAPLSSDLPSNCKAFA